jgi:hypothetical protein
MRILPHDEIEFGEFKGRKKKWEKLLEITNQEMRDALMHLIVYQGDTELHRQSSREISCRVRRASTIGNAPCASWAKNNVSAPRLNL